MSAVASYRRSTLKETLRWGACFIAILGIHGAVAATLLLNTPEADADTFDDTVALEVDFTTEAFQNAEARDVAPGEEQMQTDAAPPPMEKAEMKAEAETEPVKEPLPTKEEPTPVPPLPAMAEPDAVIETAAPQEAKKKEEEEKKDDTEKTPNSAPPVVSASATTAPTASAMRTARVVSWKRRMALHLQRNKRYPTEAQNKRHSGVARVSFVIDRNGHVLSSSIVQGSGSAPLDREALDMLHRADPLPTPPDELSGTQFSFNLPILFELK